MKNTIVSSIPQDRLFTREQVDKLLSEVIGKTLGEVDKKGVIDEFEKTRPDRVVRGVAGDVIELSVLGCQRDSRPEPDIWVDNVKTELKTTGLVGSKGKGKKSEYQPKEPLTITGVSPDNLKNESFEDSRFYHKIEHLLFVFYHYNLTRKVQNSGDYRGFPIVGHFFWNVSNEHLEQLRNDWLLVQEFVRQFQFTDEEERHKLKKNLLLIDYSSPNQPRFRFKRTFVSTIVDIFLKNRKLQSLPTRITRYSDIDEKCRKFTEQYGGRTLKDISHELGIKITKKDSCQQVIIKMFDSNVRSINKIRDFSEIGLTSKTLILTSEGERTEDMKMFKIDFDEWCSPTTTFTEQEDTQGELFERNCSQMYSYFSERMFMFIVFEEPYKGKNIPLEECKFKGFKRYSFKENFINQDVRKTWEEVRRLVLNKELVEIQTVRGSAPNFPKSQDNIVFVRGSGVDSSCKRKVLDNWGIDMRMYTQYVWIRGDYIVSQLKDIQYL